MSPRHTQLSLRQVRITRLRLQLAGSEGRTRHGRLQTMASVLSYPVPHLSQENQTKEKHSMPCLLCLCPLSYLAQDCEKEKETTTKPRVTYTNQISSASAWEDAARARTSRRGAALTMLPAYTCTPCLPPDKD